MRFQPLFLQLIFFLFPFCLGASTAPSLYFSPDGQLAKHLIAYIDEEKESLHIAIYCLTHRAITEALVQAKKRGVEVELIVDPFSVKSHSPLVRLAEEGIPIYVWLPAPERENRTSSPKMHNKFCIFGKKAVWTGSFNFTYEADRNNCENALYLQDIGVVKKFETQFRSLKKKGSMLYEHYLTAHPKKKKKSLAKKNPLPEPDQVAAQPSKNV